MDNNKLHIIFDNYIKRFHYLNSGSRLESYKWQICQAFPSKMREALESPTDEFANKLKAVEKLSYNIPDSNVRPFDGLVVIARENPEAVRKLFLDLYKPDNNDLDIKKERIDTFLHNSTDLFNEYIGTGFRYKQSPWSVSAYQFLNEPDHYYLFKPLHARAFADCVEFYDDWGTGENIKWEVFYRMCDQLVEAINDYPALLEIDATRFKEFSKVPGDMHPDTLKHILAYDIIYCAYEYYLYSGQEPENGEKGKSKILSPKTREYHLQMQRKAIEEQANYQKTFDDFDRLIIAVDYLCETFKVGTSVIHKQYGEGIVKTINHKLYDPSAIVSFKNRDVKFGICTVVANDLITTTDIHFCEMVSQYMDVLKRCQDLPKTAATAEKILEPYKEYLD